MVNSNHHQCSVKPRKTPSAIRVRAQGLCRLEVLGERLVVLGAVVAHDVGVVAGTVRDWVGIEHASKYPS